MQLAGIFHSAWVCVSGSPPAKVRQELRYGRPVAVGVDRYSELVNPGCPSAGWMLLLFSYNLFRVNRVLFSHLGGSSLVDKVNRLLLERKKMYVQV